MSLIRNCMKVSCKKRRLWKHRSSFRSVATTIKTCGCLNPQGSIEELVSTSFRPSISLEILWVTTMVLDAVRETKLPSSRPTTIIITTEKTYLATWTKISSTRISPLSFKNLSKGHFCTIRENSISVSGYFSMLLMARSICLQSPM